MSHFIFKFYKIGFWFLVPFIFTSNTYVDQMPWTLNGYGEESNGVHRVFRELIDGKVTFETVVRSNELGTPFSSVSLKFVNDKGDGNQTMEFLIKKKDSKEGLQIGEYKLPDHINGLLNDFEGVFGYADIKLFGEAPLFTDKGKVVITEVDTYGLKGYLNVVFKNPKGKEMVVQGDFHAVSATLE